MSRFLLHNFKNSRFLFFLVKISLNKRLKTANLKSKKKIKERMEPIVQSLRKSFNSSSTRSLKWRLQQLASIERLIDENHIELVKALRKDLNKPEQEIVAFEFAMIKNAVAHTANNLNSWLKPHKETPIIQARALYSLYTLYEPLGVALVIGAWNYPVTLLTK